MLRESGFLASAKRKGRPNAMPTKEDTTSSGSAFLERRALAHDGLCSGEVIPPREFTEAANDHTEHVSRQPSALIEQPDHGAGKKK